MPDLIRDILNDLYAVEPSLVQREAELVPIIQKLLVAKPDAHLDPAFREQLRQQIAHRIAVRSTTPFFSFFTMRKLSYALMSVFALAAVGVGTYAYVTHTEPASVATQDASTAPRVAITNRGDSAFGNFSASASTMQSTSAREATGMGGSTKTTANSPATSDDTSATSSLIAPVPARVYEYVYTGEPLTIPSASVLKRTNQLPTSVLNTVVRSANLGLVDVEKFSNLTVQTLVLAEDKDEGYSVSMDLREGTVSVYQNWERWAQPLREAASNVNSTPALPSDDQLIATANAFLDKYAIPRSAYGTPVVPKYFLGYGDTAMKAGMGFIQSVQVVYPLSVSGTPVVNENGYPVGLTVDIDLTLNRVTSVSNLTGLTYEASAYPIVRDTARILTVVKNGGVYGSAIADETVQRVQVEVGTPTVGYLPSRYQIEQTSTEYLIPALIFPITKAPQGEQLYRTAIVVPLVQDVLDQQVKALPATSAGAAVDTPAVAPDSR